MMNKNLKKNWWKPFQTVMCQPQFLSSMFACCQWIVNADPKTSVDWATFIGLQEMKSSLTNTFSAWWCDDQSVIPLPSSINFVGQENDVLHKRRGVFITTTGLGSLDTAWTFSLWRVTNGRDSFDGGTICAEYSTSTSPSIGPNSLLEKKMHLHIDRLLMFRHSGC